MYKSIPFIVLIASVVLYGAAFSPIDLAEVAYFLTLPLLLWSFFSPPFKRFFVTAFVSGFAVWLWLLIWLRHVTWAGTFALASYLAIITVTWFMIARWALPRLPERSFPIRLLGLLGLAGTWVWIEWVRSFLFTGFLWLPLAASQWQRPVLLQLAAWTGAYGVSFVLIFCNLALAFTVYTLLWRRSRVPVEGYLVLALLGGMIGLFAPSIPSTQREPLFTVGIVQPYIEPSLKWEPEAARENLRILAEQTTLAKDTQTDLVLWPETATPWPVKGFPEMRRWIEARVLELGCPLLMGNLVSEGYVLENGIFVVSPDRGLHERYYAKRKLVPFGEYVPLRRWLPFVDKVVPIGGDFQPGEAFSLLPLKIQDRMYQVGGLVCYEDIFPQLARATVAEGADFIFVATNNAWYGEEGGAYQHAAHSVLRAVETRRPVLRCGNGGWSGWIDAYGHVRQVLTDEKGSVYFRGAEQIQVDRDPRWSGRHSFYVRYGDWFIGLCFGFMIGGYFVVKKN